MRARARASGKDAATGSVRHGELLLAGLLRCDHCGRKMYVAYGGKAGRYLCEGALVNHGTESCMSIMLSGSAVILLMELYRIEVAA